MSRDRYGNRMKPLSERQHDAFDKPAQKRKEKKRGQVGRESFHNWTFVALRGRPMGRVLDCNPNADTVHPTLAPWPNGAPRGKARKRPQLFSDLLRLFQVRVPFQPRFVEVQQLPRLL